MSFKVSFAQNREDVIIEAFFPDVEKGFYVDVGASDPDEDSVTKLFYEKGWSGINIEPIQSKFHLLEEKRTRDINLNIGLSDKKGSLMFREYEGTGLSTFSPQIKTEHANHETANVTKFVDRSVPVDTLKNVLTEYKVPHTHFMKVDVEGFEYEVLQGNDWKKFRPELLCIEANHIKHDWRPLLERNHYEWVFTDGLNEYYLRAESLKRKNHFSYADKFLAGPQIIKWTVDQEIKLITGNYENNIRALQFTQEHILREKKEIEKEYRDSLRISQLLINLKKALADRVKGLLKR